MKNNSAFPDEQSLLSMFSEVNTLNSNAHIHTPYSFSAFNDIPSIFKMAVDENIACLGINDFFVTDGYESFNSEAEKNGIVPLFNIEFIGLLRDEQKAGIRVNDPNNPGRCYFCGKGLDFPFHLEPQLKEKLERIKAMSQEQVKAMIGKVNSLFSEMRSDVRLDYNEIRKTLAKNLVRERHIAKAIRIAVFEKHTDDYGRTAFLTKLFEKKPESAVTDIPAVENEIRSNLLKAGGRAFVEEDEETFMSIDEIMEIITDAGGIPCYPVLLDDKKGSYTEFERSFEKLHKELTKHNIRCIELIPGRNDATHLETFVNYFNEKGYIILMGTEHNTPEMIPVTCDTRGKKPLSPRMKEIAWQGACQVAAHQYLRSAGKNGFPVKGRSVSDDERKYLARLGNAWIHYHRKNNKHE